MSNHNRSGGWRKEYHIAANCNGIIKELSVRWLRGLGYPNYSEAYNILADGRGLIHPFDRPYIDKLDELIHCLRHCRTLFVQLDRGSDKDRSGSARKAMKDMRKVNDKLKEKVDSVLEPAIKLHMAAMQGRHPRHFGEDVTYDYRNILRGLVQCHGYGLLLMSEKELMSEFVDFYAKHQADHIAACAAAKREGRKAPQPPFYKIHYGSKWTIRTDYYNKRANSDYIRRNIEQIIDIPLIFDSSAQSIIMANLETARELNNILDDFAEKHIDERRCARPDLNVNDVRQLADDIARLVFIRFPEDA